MYFLHERKTLTLFFISINETCLDLPFLCSPAPWPPLRFSAPIRTPFHYFLDFLKGPHLPSSTRPAISVMAQDRSYTTHQLRRFTSHSWMALCHTHQVRHGGLQRRAAGKGPLHWRRLGQCRGRWRIFTVWFRTYEGPRWLSRLEEAS